ETQNRRRKRSTWAVWWPPPPVVCAIGYVGYAGGAPGGRPPSPPTATGAQGSGVRAQVGGAPRRRPEPRALSPEPFHKPTGPARKARRPGPAKLESPGPTTTSRLRRQIPDRVHEHPHLLRVR